MPNLDIMLFVVVMVAFITELASAIPLVRWIYWKATTLQATVTVLFMSTLIIATGWWLDSLIFWYPHR